MWIFLLILSSLSWAFPVLHFIKPEYSFTQITTLDACGTYLNANDVVGCNPALFVFQKEKGLKMGLNTISDGGSVEMGQKLLFSPMKEETLREIFQKRSFNSWGANSYIELRTPSFFLGYDPLTVNADIYVFNPASPEVAMSLIKSNRLKFTTGMRLMDNDFLEANFGTKVFYYRSEYYQDSFFLSELSTTDAKKLVKFRKRSGVAADVGGFLRFKNGLLPKISFLVKNVGSKFTNSQQDIIAENQMRPLLVYETYSKASFGYDFKTKFGAINTELALPFRNLYENLYSDYICGSLGYSLSKFSAQAAYSKYQQVLGLHFMSKIASIGIFFGRSRPLGDFSGQIDRVSGINAEVSL